MVRNRLTIEVNDSYDPYLTTLIILSEQFLEVGLRSAPQPTVIAQRTTLALRQDTLKALIHTFQSSRTPTLALSVVVEKRKIRVDWDYRQQKSPPRPHRMHDVEGLLFALGKLAVISCLRR